MPTLRLALLGPPLIEHHGSSLSLDRQKAVALLAYLSLTGRRHGREALAALLWPDLAPERALAALRQAIWALNQALGEGVVASDRTTVGLVAGLELELDVAVFHAHLAVAQREADPVPALTAAVALYRGELLEGLELRASAPFSEWCFFEREALRDAYVGALDQLTARLIEQGAYEAALAIARCRLALDPLHEPAHCMLMRIYAALGQRSAALRQYEEWVRLLAAELGAEPEPATQALYAQLRASMTERRTPAGPVQSWGKVPASERGLLAREDQTRAGSPHSQEKYEHVAPAVVPSRNPTALPSPTTPFVGRESELAHVTALLADPDCRLLSILGPGGMGKTRLAIEAARQAITTFADGVVFVALAAMNEPDLILSALAEALGLDLFRRERLDDLLADFLRPRHMLVVADNLEQLIAGVAQLAALLEAAPGLKILATSRERLGLAGEWTLELGGLPLPDEHGAAGEAAAVRLFMHGMRRATGGHGPATGELGTVAQICHLVGGTPLAIELAAAWTRLMALDEIVSALRRDLDFLAGGARGLPERHRGLRAVFEHSWRLLSPFDQSAFRRLAVFRGGFTREAVGAVLGRANWSPAQQVALGQMRWPSDQQVALQALAALSDRSLVRTVGNGRYDLHELVRQYAAEHLASDPAELAAARSAQRNYFLHLLQQHEADLKGAGQRNALAAISSDLDNIRLAWRQAISDADWPALAAALESLFLFYEIESLHDEGEDAFGRAASALAMHPQPAEAEQILLVNLLARWGWFALRMYRFAPARAIFQWCLELSTQLGPRRATAFAELLATCQIATGGQVVSLDRLREQVARVRATGDRWSLALALNSLAYAAPSEAEAVTLFEESLGLCRLIGDQRGIASNLDALGEIASDQARLAQAIGYWEEALARYAEMGYRWAHAFCLDKIGYVRRRMGELAAAEQLHLASLEGSRAIGDRLGVAGSLDNLGLVKLDAGDLEAAAHYFHEGCAIREAIGHSGSIAISQLNLGMLALARGDLERCHTALDAAFASADPAADWLRARVLRVRARAALAAGDATACAGHLRTALGMVASRGGGYDVAVVMATLAEAQLRLGAEGLAAELAATALSLAGEVPRVRQLAAGVLTVTGQPNQPRSLAALMLALG